MATNVIKGILKAVLSVQQDCKTVKRKQQGGASEVHENEVEELHENELNEIPTKRSKTTLGALVVRRLSKEGKRFGRTSKVAPKLMIEKKTFQRVTSCGFDIQRILRDDFTDCWEMGGKASSCYIGSYGYLQAYRHIETDEVEGLCKGRFGHTSHENVLMAKIRNRTKFQREITILASIGPNAPYILGMYECYDKTPETPYYGIIFPDFACTLKQAFQMIGSYMLSEYALCVKQIASALHFLHSSGIAHGSLGFDTIVVERQNAIQPIMLGDFAESDIIDPDKSRDGKDHKDMWDLGLIIFRLLFGYHPFLVCTNCHKKNKIIHLFTDSEASLLTKYAQYSIYQPTRSRAISLSHAEILDGLLTMQSEERMMAEDVIKDLHLKRLIESKGDERCYAPRSSENFEEVYVDNKHSIVKFKHLEITQHNVFK